MRATVRSRKVKLNVLHIILKEYVQVSQKVLFPLRGKFFLCNVVLLLFHIQRLTSGENLLFLYVVLR